LTILRGIEVDRRRYPLVVVHIGRTYSEAAWSEMAAHLVELVRQGPYGLVSDTRGSAIPTPLQRRWVSRYYAEHDRDVRKNLLAAAVVADSMIARGVLTALQWVRPMPHPLQVFATLIRDPVRRRGVGARALSRNVAARGAAPPRARYGSGLTPLRQPGSVSSRAPTRRLFSLPA
jgi:hypothetical protein